LQPAARYNRGVSSFPSFSFDHFELDTFARRLTRDGQPIAIADRHFDVLHRLVSHPGERVSKDALVSAGWGDVAVTDNSLEQAISSLRRALGSRTAGDPYIETVPRRGYRFTAAVDRRTARATDESLDLLMAPHRAWLEGRAALETLEGERISRAQRDFEQVLQAFPDHALAHVGLANAWAMQFEMTRASGPNREALAAARTHAREACRLDPAAAETWATLGFVLTCAGEPVDAVAALQRAVTIEPDNWRHHFRLAYASWGEQRLRAARRTLALLPGFPLAHWLAATVYVARNVLDEAERELTAGIAGQNAQGTEARFTAVALHWLLGLVLLARGDEDAALVEFQRELASEASGHFYARECCANTWYAIGALRVRQRRMDEARGAFKETLARVPNHPFALCMLAVLEYLSGGELSITAEDRARFEGGIAAAIVSTLAGHTADAVQDVDRALASAAPGSAGWLVPVEPLLQVAKAPEAWAPVLGRLRARAA
jgi:DNA-binding winged helix-turn-helix (wHTH) protein/Tfp pilus assembly protein PilF